MQRYLTSDTQGGGRARTLIVIMNDIQNRKDVELLIDNFYKRVIVDDVIGFIFTDVVQLDWETHIPVMYDFWETTLLGEMKYRGNPMLKHIELNKKEPLRADYFERWLSLWESTVRESYSGAVAEKAIQRANQIAELMKYKIQQYT